MKADPEKRKVKIPRIFLKIHGEKLKAKNKKINLAQSLECDCG